VNEHGTVENCQAFDVLALYRMGALKEETVSYPWVGFRWPGIERLTANMWQVRVRFRGGSIQTLPLTWKRLHFGGGRPWFTCRRCNRRVGKLYNTGASLTCRRCLDLWYSSQRRGAQSRRYLKALKLRLRLGGIANLREPFPDKPKRMHRTTYERLKARAEMLEHDLRDNPRFRNRETDYGPLVPR
jgi:hypothetical protein